MHVIACIVPLIPAVLCWDESFDQNLRIIENDLLVKVLGVPEDEAAARISEEKEKVKRK